MLQGLSILGDCKDNEYEHVRPALATSLTLLMARLRDVWVGADDPGAGPKFWSYGITNGLFNDNDPPVTSTRLHFAAYQTAIVESRSNTSYRWL
jgi:hypothetical protein